MGMETVLFPPAVQSRTEISLEPLEAALVVARVTAQFRATPISRTSISMIQT